MYLRYAKEVGVSVKRALYPKKRARYPKKEPYILKKSPIS